MPGPRADWLCTSCEAGGEGEGLWRDLPIEPKPSCPRCRKKRFMQRQWSGYRVMVSGTRLTPTQLGTGTEGRAELAAVEAIGPDYDAQRNRADAARRAAMSDPYAAKLVGPDQLATVIAGLPLALPAGANPNEPSRALPLMPRGVTNVAGGMRLPSKIDKTHVVARYEGDGR